jgi:Phosphotransferase enzyme family
LLRACGPVVVGVAVVDVISRLVDDRAVVTDMMRAATGRTRAELAGSVQVDAVPVVSMTTAALVRVRGDLTDGDDTAAWSVVLKVVRSPDRSPIWAQIPPEYHQVALTEIPWRTEPQLYGSTLRDQLPAGVRLPVVYSVDEVGDGTIAIWMEDVVQVDGPWTLADYRRVGRGLGRLAGRFPESADAGPLPLRRRNLRFYFFGRVSQAVLPALRDDAVWAHPLVAPVVDVDLRRDLHALADAAPAMLDRVDALPRTLAHGDACPQNLLRGVDGDVVAIDWQFASWCAVGFDVGQLIAGHAESGDLEPAQLEAAYVGVLEEYIKGLHDEGMTVRADDVALGAAGALIIRSAFTALPLEFLAVEPTTDLVRLFDRRAGFARFLVNLARAHLTFGHPPAAAV